MILVAPATREALRGAAQEASDPVAGALAHQRAIGGPCEDGAEGGSGQETRTTDGLGLRELPWRSRDVMSSYLNLYIIIYTFIVISSLL